MKSVRWNNLVSMFFAQAQRLGDAPFLWHKRDGAYRPLSWRDTARQVRELAGGLAARGIVAGDRVVVVSENRPEWLISDMAIMSLGAITTPAYITNTADDHHHILTNSGAKGAIVSSRRFLGSLLPAAARASDLQFVIGIEETEDRKGYAGPLLRWNDVLESGTSNAGSVEWKRDQVACIIYTSGTGGKPKGVMLHHGAMLHNCEGFFENLQELGLENEVFLSFLPLSHSYEHTLGQFFPVFIGAQIYYVDGVQNLVANLPEARPTMLISVPRLYEMMRERILRDVRRERGEMVFDVATRAKAAALFGGRTKAMIAGGAPLNPDVGAFFEKLGLQILQGYGQTESGPLISVNRPRGVKHHTVGLPVPHTDIVIAGDGEVLVRGELVMKGYWQDPERTAATVIDGWLHTGDVGLIDADGHLQITDRKKDIIVNSGGDNISPQRVEGILTLAPEILQAMVYGDRRPHLVGLLVPDPAWLQAWAAERGKPADLAVLRDDPELRKALAEVMGRINASLSNIEKVRRFVIADAPFSIENSQLTPTSKVRRNAVIAVYKDRLEGLYAS